MELHEALAQVSEIRLQIARTDSFRGYRSATAGFSALIAVATALLQPFTVPNPAADLRGYLLLWVGAAGISVAATALEMAIRCRRSASATAARLTWLAVEQFLPSLLAGAVVTCVLALSSPEAAWMLPGLWGILFSLGIFASNRLLPREVVWVALHYLVCGAASLVWGQGTRAYSPWIMAVTFGGGQLLAALVLYLKLEREHGDA
jgi:hypothetical protein